MAKTRIRVPGHYEQLGLAPVSSVDIMAVALQCTNGQSRRCRRK